MSDNPPMVPEESVETAQTVKPQPLVSRRVAAALIDAGLVGFVGALIPLALAFGLIRLELNSTELFEHAAILFYLGSVVLLAFNWLCPMILPIVGGGWAVWIVGHGFSPHCVFPIALLSIAPLYEMVGVSSSSRATPGKRLVGLIVQGRRNSRLTPKQAFLRHCVRAVSAASIFGYCMAFVNRKHSCLHDIICKTEVVDASASDAAKSPKTSSQNMLVFIVLSVVIGVVLGMIFLMFSMQWREILRR